MQNERRNIMRIVTACFIAFVLLAALNCQKANSEDGALSKTNRRPTPEGCVESESEGPMMKAKKKLCWEGDGNKEVEILTTKVGVMGMTQETKTATYINLSEGGIVYSVDYSTDPPTGTKTINPVIESLEGKDAKEIGEQILVQMGGVRTGAKEILSI